MQSFEVTLRFLFILVYKYGLKITFYLNNAVSIKMIIPLKLMFSQMGVCSAFDW